MWPSETRYWHCSIDVVLRWFACDDSSMVWRPVVHTYTAPPPWVLRSARWDRSMTARDYDAILFQVCVYKIIYIYVNKNQLQLPQDIKVNSGQEVSWVMKSSRCHSTLVEICERLGFHERNTPAHLKWFFTSLWPHLRNGRPSPAETRKLVLSKTAEQQCNIMQ